MLQARQPMSSALACVLDALLAEFRQGQQPDLDEAARRHPALAMDLHSLWATIWLTEALAATEGSEPEPSGQMNKSTDTIDWPSPTEASSARPGLRTGGVGPASSRFGDYELYEELGQGGMGVVSRAREIGRGRIVALKRLLRGPASSSSDLERFQIEALAAAGLAHPRIVPVFQVGEHEGQPYFTMQLIEGTTLARRLAEGPMPAPEAAWLLAEVCRAIDYAHGRGVLHRDLKPSNILIDRAGNPYVSDFGLAKRLDIDPTVTPSGAIVGTPSYMAPEQAGLTGTSQRERLSPAADVYSLGAILYHMLTGRPPFQAATPVETLLLALEHDPISPRGAQPSSQSRPRDGCAQMPAKTAGAALSVGGSPRRRPGSIYAWRVGLRALGKPARARRAVDGRNSPHACPRKLGPALDLPQHCAFWSSLGLPTGSTLRGCRLAGRTFSFSRPACAVGRGFSGPCAAGVGRSDLSSDSSRTSGEPASSRSTWSSWWNGCWVCPC